MTHPTTNYYSASITVQLSVSFLTAYYVYSN